jgi:trimethylamine:corrinoid methyltransferase-like protein
VQAIHEGAMRILEEIGIEFLNPEAVEVLRGSGGCDINGENVRMGRDFVMEMIGKAPERVDDHARATRITQAHDRGPAPELRQRLVAAQLLGHDASAAR